MNASPGNPLLEQFLSESRELLEGAGQKLMQLEEVPNDQGVINELFRIVHTLKGNSGLFTFPEMTRVLHAGEDLLGSVRSGEVAFTREVADRLLGAMDFVGVLSDEIQSTESIDANHAAESVRLAESLRATMETASVSASLGPGGLISVTAKSIPAALAGLPQLSEVPEDCVLRPFAGAATGRKFIGLPITQHRSVSFRATIHFIVPARRRVCSGAALCPPSP